MPLYSLSLRYAVRGHGNEFVLEEHVEAMAGALAAMDRVIEPALHLDLPEASVTARLSLDADDPPAALGLGLIAVKVAAGLATDHTGRMGLSFIETDQMISRVTHQTESDHRSRAAESAL